MHAPPGSPENKMDWSLDRGDASSDAAAAGWQADGDGRDRPRRRFGVYPAQGAYGRRRARRGAALGPAVRASACLLPHGPGSHASVRACSVFLYALLLFLLLGE
jgi:hypothetical protein